VADALRWHFGDGHLSRLSCEMAQDENILNVSALSAVEEDFITPTYIDPCPLNDLPLLIPLLKIDGT
jgi:hypothetical protein